MAGCGINSPKATKADICSGVFWRDFLSEMLATFFLMSVQSALPLTWGREGDFGQSLQTGLCMGFIVATMAWSLGDFGGGHMNPAVTFAMMLSANIGILRGLFYMIAQCAGAIAGAAFIYGVTPSDFQDTLAATELGKNVQPWQGFLIEMWITTILVTTIYGATNSKRKQGKVGMPTVVIGMAICLGITCGFKSTGGSMNPARSLGPAVVKGIWENHWVYWAGPLAGGALSTLFYVAILDRVGRKASGQGDINKYEMRDGEENKGYIEDTADRF